MAYADFTAGDVFTAANADLLMRQSVMTFASAAARDSALTGVLVDGMMAYLQDVDTLTLYVNSGWFAISRPSNRTIASGDFSGTTDANGIVTVTYGVTFASAPVFVAMPSLTTDLQLSVHTTGASVPGTTSAQLKVVRDGVLYASSAIVVRWIAVGAIAL